MSLIENIASIVIITAVSATAAQTIVEALRLTGKAQLRSSANTVINQDIEAVRQTVYAWEFQTLKFETEGVQSYFAKCPTVNPEKEKCEDVRKALCDNLGTALLDDEAQTLPASSKLDLSSISSPLGGLVVTRTISTANGNPNIINVLYSTSGGNITTEVNANLLIPAQGWCP